MERDPHSETPQPVAPLVVMVGPPGSGKSTWAAGRFPHDQMFSLDMFRRLLSGDMLEQNASAAAVGMMHVVLVYRTGHAMTTVVDATNVNWEHRDTLRWTAQQAGRPAVAVMMHTPLQTCLARNAARTAAAWSGANDRPVPSDVIERMHAAAVADPPAADEFDLVVHVHPDDPDVAYALCPRRRSTSWARKLLAAPWGKNITLLTGGGARLPWPTLVNDRLDSQRRG